MLRESAFTVTKKNAPKHTGLIQEETITTPEAMEQEGQAQLPTDPDMASYVQAVTRTVKKL